MQEESSTTRELVRAKVPQCIDRPHRGSWPAAGTFESHSSQFHEHVLEADGG